MLRTAFYEGLSSRLIGELAVRELPETLEGMEQLAMQMVQRLGSLVCPSLCTCCIIAPPPAQGPASPSTPPSSGAHTRAGETMQIVRTFLSAAEKASQYKKGLCAYCASSDHHRAICPLRLGNGQTR